MVKVEEAKLFKEIDLDLDKILFLFSVINGYLKSMDSIEIECVTSSFSVSYNEVLYRLNENLQELKDIRENE